MTLVRLFTQLQANTGAVVNSIHHVNTENKNEIKEQKKNEKKNKCYHVSNETIFRK